MKPEQLRAAIDRIWGGNQSQAARDLGVDPRRIRAFLTDPENPSWRKIPDTLGDDVMGFLASIPEGKTNVDVQRALTFLHNRLVSAGLSEAVAASQIAAVAMSRLRRHVEPETIADLIGGNDFTTKTETAAGECTE